MILKGFYKEYIIDPTDNAPNAKKNIAVFAEPLPVIVSDKQTSASTPNSAPPIYPIIDPALTNGSRLSSL